MQFWQERKCKDAIMGRRFWAFVLGIGLIGGGVVMFVGSPKPAMKYAPVDMDAVGKREYVKVPYDEDAKGEQVVRRVLHVAGAVLFFAGVCLSAASAGFRKRPSDLLKGGASPTVYVRVGGQHFHKQFCPYLRGVQLISKSQALDEKYQECPLCRPALCNEEGQVFVRKGGKHFHREDCLFLAKTRPLSRLEALAAGFKPCDRCGA
jgi:hypothetical protein